MATDRKKPYTIYKSQATGWWCCEVVGYDENNVEVIVDQQCFPTKKKQKNMLKNTMGMGARKIASPKIIVPLTYVFYPLMWMPWFVVVI